MIFKILLVTIDILGVCVCVYVWGLCESAKRRRGHCILQSWKYVYLVASCPYWVLGTQLRTSGWAESIVLTEPSFLTSLWLDLLFLMIDSIGFIFMDYWPFLYQPYGELNKQTLPFFCQLNISKSYLGRRISIEKIPPAVYLRPISL